MADTSEQSFYDFTATDIDGNELVQLDQRYRERGLRILGFPCNQFGGQEPGTNEEIKAFAAGYGVEFDMFDKINVNGSDAHPLYAYLKKKQKGFLLNAIKWNFSKFLIDRRGVPVKRYAPNEEPLSIIPEIERLLNESV
ncbi:thioredoxin-like protein [Syncephalis pseudoplumigaleata]|uniref:Glutathione peroxidase n=1 Tax=Syncephalis pseudoplumigaleata TaxID=1712513 RepID=A0A4V1J296_9FUNG|nr:thioredoxin-like protein [Syncephalis pseudoplumigaleata]|eukprot:RKP27789.1 thioredoxin-like protein [Syncephalis pseudoplumigaleata]